ncbi:MAG: hypothetical protein ACFFCY_09525 [Promethearchaeota archaeon]
MFKEITQFYTIGKELGLNRSEINRTLIFSSNRSLLFKLLLIFILVLITVIVVVVVIVASRSIYPSGTLYSTVKINDFKQKK